MEYVILAWIFMSFMAVVINAMLVREVSMDIKALKQFIAANPEKADGRLTHAWSNARSAMTGLVSAIAFLLLGWVSYVRFVQGERWPVLRWVAIGLLFFALATLTYNALRDYLMVRSYVHDE